VLTESAARWLLVLHTALGVAAVGAATHLVIWMRGYLRGNYARHRSVRRFAVISLVLHALAFTAGNLMYPTYKVEVRVAYLENAGAIVADRSAHQAELDKIADRERAPRIEHPPAGDAVKRAARIARWFDVKEHWIALGLMASAALVFLLAFWDPRTDRTPLAPVALGLAVVIAGTVWLGAIIGVLTAASRAV
jgi:putative Ca2+/H+ antiporter (TMEM165/GDT1 family)